MFNFNDLADSYINDFIFANDIKKEINKEQREELIIIYNQITESVEQASFNMPIKMSILGVEFANYVLSTYFSYLKRDSNLLNFILRSVGDELSAEISSLDIESAEAKSDLAALLYNSAVKLMMDINDEMDDF